MKPPTLAVLLALFSTSVAHAQPVARIQVTEMKPLLTRAAAEGSAYGVLVGVGADYLQRRFNATAPVEIDVRALHALPQPGCSRLEVTTRQRDVVENGKREDKDLVYQLSFCRDGTFPGKQ